VTGALLLAQGVAEIIRCVLCIRLGQWPQRLHDVEEIEAVILQERRRLAEQAEPGAKGSRDAPT
jgi:hypothetical protein